jgi:ABC-type glycerol-3-phosphate transport system substrate-binding protein
VEDGGKKMKHKISVFMIFVLVFSMLFTGCFSRGNSKENKSNNKTTIKVAILYPEKEQGAVYKEIAKKFEEQNKDIKVDIVTDFSDEDKIKETLSQNGDIDIVGIKRNQVIEFARSGLITDLSEMVEKNDLTRKLYKVSLSYGKYNGKIYGIADMPMTIEWFYNVDMFNRLNIKVPRNYAELSEACAKLKANKINPISVGGMDGWALGTLFGMITAQTSGVAEFTSNYGSDKEGYKNIQGIREAFNIYRKIIEQCIPKSNADINYRQSVDDFIKGKAAILPTGSWVVELIEQLKPSGFQYQVFENGLEFVDNPISKYSASGGQVLVVSSKSKNSKEAQKFLEFLFSEVGQKLFVEKGYISSLAAANKDDSSIKRQLLSHLEMTDDNSVMLIDNLEPKIAENTTRVLQDILEGRVKPSEGWDRVLKITFQQ